MVSRRGGTECAAGGGFNRLFVKFLDNGRQRGEDFAPWAIDHWSTTSIRWWSWSWRKSCCGAAASTLFMCNAPVSMWSGAWYLQPWRYVASSGTVSGRNWLASGHRRRHFSGWSSTPEKSLWCTKDHLLRPIQSHVCTQFLMVFQDPECCCGAPYCDCYDIKPSALASLKPSTR